MFDTIIFIILFAIVLAVFFKILKSIMKVLFIGLLILVFLVGSLGFIAYNDISSLKQNIQTKPILYLFDDQGNLASGFADGNLLNKTQLTGFQEKYGNDNLKDIKGDYYKIIIFYDEYENPEAKIAEIGTSQIFDMYKKGQIRVYPKTIVFAMLNYIPSWLVKTLLWIL